MKIGQYMHCLSWRVTGIIVGCVAIIFSIAEIGLVSSMHEEDDSILEIMLTAVLNTFCSICWLFGIARISKVFMLVALVYWAIISSLAISFSIYVLYQEVYNGNESHIYRKSEHLIYGISMFILVHYLIALGSYKRMKKSNPTKSTNYWTII